MKKIVLLGLVCLTLLALVGCGKKEAEKAPINEQVNEPVTEINTETSNQVKNDKAIVGNWKNDELGVDFIYIFHDDGTGNYNAAGTDMPFTYTADGTNLSITYPDADVPFDTQYSINGDVLNVLDSTGADTLYQKISTEEGSVPKSEQIGTAGSNIPLKDNLEEAEYQIKVAMQDLLVEAYGTDVFDARIYVEKMYTYEEEQEIPELKERNLGPNEVAFEVKYEIKPAEGVDPIKFTAATGEYDEESGWVKEKYNLGILRPNEDGDAKYKITDFGTGW